MERIILRDLIKWKENTRDRQPLLLYGARQVGKTYILQEFGRDYYKNSIYINFERMPIVGEFFDGDLFPDRLIQLLEEYFNQKIIPGDTLLIFDEIQACERALTSLKYFCEEAPEYHVIGAGSLLGVAVHREKFSFPVGKVTMKTLYPFRFDEFLMATGNKTLVGLIQEHYDNMTEMPEETHKELLRWLRRYYFVGGMPAAIKKYLDEESFVNIPEIQSMILNSYTADMAKYSTVGECTKIQNAFKSLPAQLSKDNKKFQYKLIRKGATAGLFGDSISWLEMAGVAIKCDRTTRGELPINVFRDVSAFKLYLSDVGLLSAFTNILPDSIMRDELSDVYKGALAENYVAQTLKVKHRDLFYWTSDSPESEVDFVIQLDGKVVPIEVKYDTNVHARSIKHFVAMYHPVEVIRLSARNFGREGEILSVPLYAAFCL